jgi:hypothetical protein
MKTRSSPKLLRPSFMAPTSPSRASWSFQASRMPLPPPPADAFSITG